MSKLIANSFNPCIKQDAHNEFLLKFPHDRYDRTYLGPIFVLPDKFMMTWRDVTQLFLHGIPSKLIGYFCIIWVTNCGSYTGSFFFICLQEKGQSKIRRIHFLLKGFYDLKNLKS